MPFLYVVELGLVILFVGFVLTQVVWPLREVP